MESSPSTISDLNKVVEAENPFDRSLSVRSHDIWEQKFPDVPFINGHVSDAIFQSIDQIRKGQRSVVGITITAERGLGKSHLISRIRRRLKEEDGSFFIYMSETDYGDLNRINSQFLNTLAFSLKQEGSKGVTQWQELATDLVNQARSSDLAPQDLLNRCPGALIKNPKLVEKLTAKICEEKSEIRDPYVLQAIFWTLFKDREVFAINWLAGKELTQTQADAMGLPVVKDEDRESRALDIANQILDLIGDYRSIVICFDEVEPKSSNSRGMPTPQVVALLAKDLYSKIKRGVLMMAIFPLTWSHSVKSMPQADSVIDRIGEKVFDLKPLGSDDVVALISHWLKDFYDRKGLTPIFPTYPFDEAELRELGKEKPIVRQVLKWCRDHWNTPNRVLATDATDPLHQVELAFNEQLLAIDGSISDYMEDSALIANALWLGFVSILGETIGQVHVQDVEEVEVKAVDTGYLSFRVVGQEGEKTVKIGVSVLQESGGRYVSAALKRLIDYKKFDFSRGCLVRSKDVKANTKGSGYLNSLLSELGGEWVALKDADIQPLLAILFVWGSCEEYEVTEEQVLEFMEHKRIAKDNYLIAEILSDPSGQVPDNVTDEDQIITSSTPFSSEATLTSDDELFDGLNA